MVEELKSENHIHSGPKLISQGAEAVTLFDDSGFRESTSLTFGESPVW